ncbi:MAG: globin-coupled sensor protein, partial [Alphaproteobacteria bacterium]|nr:globin-coupled sensor protein [Alphaproteobacteria bacterium]
MNDRENVKAGQEIRGRERETRLRFMRVNSATDEALREFWPVVEKALPEVLDAFYRHLMAEPELVRIIGNNQVSRLKSAQSAHWERLFNGRFDETYIQSVRTIGLVHNRIGLEPFWYVGGYALVLSHLTDLAIKAYRRKPQRLGEVITAVNSAVMLDMGFAISVYQEAGVEDRRKAMIDVAARLEEGVGAILVGVTSQVTELQGTAESMTEIVGATTMRVATVAAASEEALVNVQTVAAAAEELTASVREISRQVEQSASIATQAVAEAGGTMVAIKGLAEMAQKIDNVVNI